MGWPRRYGLGDLRDRRMSAPDQRNRAGGGRGAVEAPGRVHGRCEDASRFGAHDHQGVTRHHAVFDTVDALKGLARLLRIDTGLQVHQGGAAVRDVRVPPALAVGCHRVDWHGRVPRLHVVVRDDHDDRLRPASGHRSEQFADQRVGGSIAGPGRVTFRAVVVADRVGFVDVAEDQAQARVVDGVDQVRKNGRVHGIAVRIQRRAGRDDPVGWPAQVGGSRTEEAAVVTNHCRGANTRHAAAIEDGRYARRLDAGPGRQADVPPGGCPNPVRRRPASGQQRAEAGIGRGGEVGGAARGGTTASLREIPHPGRQRSRDGAMGKAVQSEQDHTGHRPIRTGVLPPLFRTALDGADELLVSSREGGRERGVRVWFIVTPDGDIYLFNYAYAIRVARWRNDPWVRLTVPGTGQSVEGRVRFIDPAELAVAIQDQVVERWGMWGATTPEGLRRMVRDGSHVLVRVEVP